MDMNRGVERCAEKYCRFLVNAGQKAYDLLNRMEDGA